MTWLLLTWTVALVIVCYWLYSATKNGSDLDEEQIARRMRNAA